MKIDAIKLKDMRNDRHFQFHVEIRNLIRGLTAAALRIAQLFGAYEHSIDREDEALKKISKSPKTELIREADAERDEIYGALVERVRADSRHYDPDIRAAAKRLLIVFDTYGNISSKPIADQTSAVYNLIQELRLPKYADDIALLGITEWIAKLEAKNNEVDALYVQRLEEDAGKTHIVMKEARTATDAAYRAIVKRVEALIEVNGPEGYEQFVNMVNAIVAKFSVKPRHGKHGAQETEGE